MDLTQWYATALGGIVALFFISHRIFLMFKPIHNKATVYFHKHLYYPMAHRYIRRPEKTTRFDVGLIVVFVIGNAICLGFGVKNLAGLTKRSGVMCTINPMPLAFGAHMNVVANWCGVSLLAYTRMHKWLGSMVMAEGLLHAAVGALSQKISLHSTTGIASLTAGVVIGSLLLSSLASIRRHFYEIFQKLHLIFAIVLIVAIYLHSESRMLSAPPMVYLLVTICLHIFTAIIRLGQILYRSVKYKNFLNRATVRTITYKTRQLEIPVSEAVHVHVRLSRPWTPRAGHYVYLCIPGLSYTSFMQSHPFYVSWWYRDAEGDVIVLIAERRKGFTQNLCHHATSNFDLQGKMRAVIEGPYGRELDIESYGTVLLFATGMGITGQLPYVKQLLDGYHDCKVKNRKVTLFWELDSEIHAAWVADMMQKLLEKDTDQILDIRLFVLGNYINSQAKPEDINHHGKCISTSYAAMDAEELIKSGIGSRKGSTVISLCTNKETNCKVREVVRGMLDTTIHLKELEYYSDSSHAHKSLWTRMVTHRRRNQGASV